MRLVKMYIKITNLTCGIANGDAVEGECRSKCP